MAILKGMPAARRLLSFLDRAFPLSSRARSGQIQGEGSGSIGNAGEAGLKTKHFQAFCPAPKSGNAGYTTRNGGAPAGVPARVDSRFGRGNSFRLSSGH